MVRLLLIAALAGCYTPDIADCADTCDSSKLCPDGLACQNGYCRAQGASGACPMNQQGMADASSAGSCPPVPMAQGCALVGPAPVEPYCHALCAAASGTAALAFSVGTWHAAVIDSPAEMMAASAIIGATKSWTGLRQAAGGSSPSAMWSWITGGAAQVPWASAQPDDGDGTEDGTEQCGVLAGSAFSDEACGTSHAFLIEPQ